MMYYRGIYYETVSLYYDRRAKFAVTMLLEKVDSCVQRLSFVSAENKPCKLLNPWDIAIFGYRLSLLFAKIAVRLLDLLNHHCQPHTTSSRALPRKSQPLVRVGLKSAIYRYPALSRVL